MFPFSGHIVSNQGQLHILPVELSMRHLEKHAGWKCPKTKKRYVKHEAKDLLNVTKIMGL